MSKITKALGLTEAQIRGALKALVELGFLDRTGDQNLETGGWLRVYKLGRGPVSESPFYRLGRTVLKLFPIDYFSYSSHQTVATLQDNSEQLASGEQASSTIKDGTSSACRSSFAEVEAVVSEVVQAAAPPFERRTHPAGSRLRRVLSGVASIFEVNAEAKANGLNPKAVVRVRGTPEVLMTDAQLQKTGSLAGMTLSAAALRRRDPY